MANQMIALGVRGPQLPDPGRATAQYAQMANMMMQQRAAERQAARTQQEMEFAAQTQTADMRAKDQAYRVAEMAQLRNRGVVVLRSRSEPAYQAWLGQVEAVDPNFAAIVRQAAPTFNADTMKYLISEADDYISKNTSQRTAKEVFDEEGNLVILDIGGDTPSRIEPGLVTNIPDPVAAARGTTPQPSQGRGMEGPPMVEPTFRGENPPLSPYQQEHLERLKAELGMTDTPASFTRGGMGATNAVQMTPDMAQTIYDSAISTGVMAQADFDQLLAMAPPQNRQAFVNMLQREKITLEPNAPSLAVSGAQTPQPEFAVMRGPAPPSRTAGLGGEPVQQTLAQYRVGQQVKGRNLNQSPYPGSAQVPLSRVRGEAEARREPPEQAAARKTAELQAAEAFEEANKETRLAREREKVFAAERAKDDAEFLEGYNNAREMGRNTLNVIRQMIGDLKVENGNLVMPKGGRAQHGGFSSVVGAGIPGLRFIPGTQSADFDAMLDQVQGGAFLEAYEKLKGTGQITEIEGTKATDAITRMKRSSSEVGFVRAAREFEDMLTRAIARADKRYSALTGAPTAAPAQRVTPTKSASGWGKAKVVGN
jgi:hypothetical protein